MKFLFCCDNYYPSVGGVQEVMRQIAERLVCNGHEITVLTSAREDRDFNEFNGVHIHEFAISGNRVFGMSGNLQAYQDFVINFDCDAILIKASCQWTFDALWDVLPQIAARKLFIPCGFSALYEPKYQQYFKEIPEILKKFDELIFYSNDYRDINFAREHGIVNYSVIPNGASEKEFSISKDTHFRAKLGIAADTFLMLTVGSFTGTKGHLELAQAVELLEIDDERQVALILNGNNPLAANHSKEDYTHHFPLTELKPDLVSTAILSYVSLVLAGCKIMAKYLLSPSKAKFHLTLVLDSWRATKHLPFNLIQAQVKKVNAHFKNKKIFITNFKRDDLIQAYMNADLFVFASQIEYSPLVLFEAAAAGTPFLTTSVGNAKELIDWLEGGYVYECKNNQAGHLVVDPQELAKKIKSTLNTGAKLKVGGQVMRENWLKKYTWQAIAAQYERLLTQSRPL